MGRPRAPCGILLPQQEKSYGQGLERRRQARERSRGADFPVALQRPGHRGIQQNEGKRRRANVEKGLGGVCRVPSQREDVVYDEVAERRERQAPRTPYGDADDQSDADSPPETFPVAARRGGPYLGGDAVDEEVGRGYKKRDGRSGGCEGCLCGGAATADVAESSEFCSDDARRDD